MSAEAFKTWIFDKQRGLAMKIRTSAPAICCAVLAMSCGFAATANSMRIDDPKKVSAVVSTTFDFRSSKWMSDRTVVNNNGEEIAKVSDLILDRGAGRIEYAVIKTGTVLGLGGKAIAIPYGAFKWEAPGGKDRFILAQTEEQLKQFAEFTPEHWKALKDISPADKSSLRQRLEKDNASASDPYAGNIETGEKLRVSGEIQSVDRVRAGKFGEQVQILVNTSKGTKKIALGPSWYVNSSPAAPMRGDKVVIETVAVPRDSDNVLAGTHVRIGENELHLRNDDGTPAWDLAGSDSSARTYSVSHSRYLLLSDLTGTKVDCRGNECGKVHDIILERTSGTVAFISIDPNQNFLGISDTKRMVPWNVASVLLDRTVRIDASKEMVLASPETPKELAALNTGAEVDRAYKAFGVPKPRFELPDRDSPLTPDGIIAWSASGPIISSIDRGTGKSLDGEVVGIIEVKFENGATPARALKVRSPASNGTEEVILLGPVWYMDNQKAMYKSGDPITIEVCRTTVDGRQYWIARSITCKDATVVLLDGKNKPAWDKP